MAGLMAEDVAALEQLANLLASLSPLSVLGIIFLKNVSALLISFVFSPLLCLVPVMALLVNGWLLGFISAAVVEEQSLGFLLGGLLPHGIFELPAFIMGEAAALSFGTAVILGVFSRERRERVLPNLRQNLRYFVIALVLLLPAAVIETFVTPLFLG
jgi:stage II sporulation protein M